VTGARAGGMKPEVRRFSTLEELSRAAAEYIVDAARRCAGECGRFTLALSGGSTPQMLFRCLARPPYAAAMPWEATHVFWVDERFVPPDHDYSNYGLAERTLLSNVPLPAAHIHRMRTEAGTPGEAAAAYEKELRSFFANDGGAFPAFDLVLLGVGADGHTASLFPGDAALDETTRWVAAVGAPPRAPNVPRITLTMPVIKKAKIATFLASGSSKQVVVSEILSGGGTATEHYPAAQVRPEGVLVWFVDKQAFMEI